jgi:hypothetical protein
MTMAKSPETTKDFTGQDLRSRSFRGEDLAGARFHASDLRGADFSGADLHGADLSTARTGMTRDWAVAVVVLALGMAVAMGFVSGVGGKWLRSLMESTDPRQRVLGVFLSVELVAFLIVFVWKGVTVAIRRVLPAAIAIAFAVGLIAVVSGAGKGTGAVAVLAFSALLATVVVFATLARAAAGTVGAAMFVLVAMTGAVVGGVSGGGLYATAIALAGMIAAQRALHGRAAQSGIAQAGAVIACAGGTRFCHTDLSDATFASAQLRSADFRGAVLRNTHFEGARVQTCAFDPDCDAPRIAG